ncbi:MAG: hypothetical protein Q8J62_10385 [Candidatus Cloacimonadaceae bacterium]|nr:hypothetical protein [Candidatus Cloacimonadaceae bacterium]
MQDQIETALGMEEIYALIDPPSNFLEKVKREHLKDPTPSLKGAVANYDRMPLLRIYIQDKKDYNRLREALAQIPEPVIPTCTGTLALHEFFLIKEFIHYYSRLRNLSRVAFWHSKFSFPDLSELAKLLDPEKSALPAFRLGPAFSNKLAALIAQKQDIFLMLNHARHSALEKAKTELGMPNLKEDFILSRAQKDLLANIQSSGHFIIVSENVANCSFRLADSKLCLALKAELSKLDLKLEKEENRVLKRLSTQIHKAVPLLKRAKKAVAEIGLIFMLTEFGIKYKCQIPKFSKITEIKLKQARNLPLELHLNRQKRNYQALDLEFNDHTNLITGPNMGGKTSILKTLGQMALLARRGIPLPCESAKIPFFEHVWYNHDSSGEDGDLSSFGREVVNFSNALQHNGFNLFLLDEFAKGTNPAEGEAIASAVLKHLGTSDGICVAATHFSAPALISDFAQFCIAGLDLKAFSSNKLKDISPAKRLKLLSDNMDFRLLRLKNNQAPPQCAIAVARVLGMPEGILTLINMEK